MHSKVSSYSKFVLRPIQNLLIALLFPKKSCGCLCMLGLFHSEDFVVL